jgi:hypothetical protein
MPPGACTPTVTADIGTVHLVPVACQNSSSWSSKALSSPRST